MRILHINKYFHERDGVGRYMHDVMQLAHEHGHQTAILSMHHPHNHPSAWDAFFVSNLETTSVAKGVGALKQLARTWWSKEAYQKTRAIIRAFMPDIIHAHNLYTHLSPSVLAAAHREGIPVVLTAHDYGYISANYSLFDGRGPIAADASWRAIVHTKCIKQSVIATAAVETIVRIQKKIGMWTKGVTHILTASHAVKRALLLGGYAHKDIRVLPLPTRACIEKKDVLRTSASTVVFAGRSEWYKGIDVVMSLAKRMPDVLFTCVGHGSRKQDLIDAAKMLPNLTVLPVRSSSEVWELMRTAAGVLVPSRWDEPFGLVALEALAVGTPAVVSNRGGLAEIVEDGVSGFVLDPDHLDAWETRIRFLIDRAISGKGMLPLRQAALARAEVIGDPATHWEALHNVYLEAIQDVQ